MRPIIHRLKFQRFWGRLARVAAMSLAVLWTAAVAKGVHWFNAYEFAPGLQADSPIRWPAGSRVTPDAGKYNLLLFMHGRCTCSRATVGELAKIAAQTGDKLSVHVLFVRPPGVQDEWVRTSLFDAAAAIPHVAVEIDPDGSEADRFGAATSGQTALYDPHGNLVFSGGITSSRGHEGDNMGATAIVCTIEGAPAPSVRTPVFGCSLLNSPSPSDPRKAVECRK